MSFENLDTDINNYSLDEILNLFELPENYNQYHINLCKKKVFNLHPDKSKLDPKYFIFFSEGLEILKKELKIRQKINNEIIVKDDEIIPLSNKKIENDFNNDKFNELWEKNKNTISYFNPNQKGYQDWLKNTENDIYSNFALQNKNKNINDAFDSLKKSLKQDGMIVYTGVQTIVIADKTNSINQEDIDDYSNVDVKLFSFNNKNKLVYEDVRKAHGVGSIIQIDENEYFKNKKKFTDVKDYETYRKI